MTTLPPFPDHQTVLQELARFCTEQAEFNNEVLTALKAARECFESLEQRLQLLEATPKTVAIVRGDLH